ncbi:alpha/beta hydrolase [Nocardioides daphniae]|uniref:DUF1023 domain-containing protein n=1 Tax=Nocardioides daphniae TaxID=402297 RepID=A0ABQ1PYS4_9ACTN|nr:alpha/beta hydrolase [Nocardioides daphniae]GGD07288.1 hypothetical protein GCM10007231_02480 [Nocardioides daphniae]
MSAEAAALAAELAAAGHASGVAAVRLEEFAQEAERRWPPGVWRGQAWTTYAAQVATAASETRTSARRWRRVAEELLVLAERVTAGEVSVDEAGELVAGLAAGGSLSTKSSGGGEEVDEVTRRDRAHRAAVALDAAAGRTRRADGLLDPDEEVVWRNARSVDRMLDRTPGATVWAYDPDAFDGDGAVVVGVGDVREADHRVVLVPGVGTDVRDVGVQVERVEAVVAAAEQHGPAAGWFWLGYDAPDAVTDEAARTQARAEQGGEVLARDVAGLRAALPDGPGEEARWTTLGHSYGATTTSYAATHGALDADAVVLVGAPGAGAAEQASDLGVDEVYVGRDSRDVVATLGGEGRAGREGVGLGLDPASEQFGAVRFRAERPDRGWTLGAGEAHSGYFTPGGESLGNIGAVVAGEVDRVELAAPAGDPWWGRPRDPEWRRGVEGSP